MHPDLEKLVFKSNTIPSLPAVYKKIREAVEDPDSTIEDIARIVCNDQALSARLLRLANSAFYGYPSEVCSITDALTVIGLQQFKNMALCTAAMDVFKNIPSTFFNMEEFWRKSIACGLCARILALQLRDANSERFFLGGLLHRVGKLILCKELPQECIQIIKTARKEETHTHSAESELLGFNHAEMGAALLAHWNLPSTLGELVGNYLDPMKAKSSISDVTLIHIADFITEGLEIGQAGEQFVPKFSGTAWDHCGLKVSDLPAAIEELQRQYEDVCQVFLGHD